MTSSNDNQSSRRTAPEGFDQEPGGSLFGRKVPKGRLRWYLASCHEGHERSTCEKLRSLMPPELLEDAFVPRKERAKKVRGEWVTDVMDLFRGYFIVVTSDAAGLAKELTRLSFPVRLAGAVGRGFAPIAADAQEMLTRLMDRSHVVRESTAEIVGDELRILYGPLVGFEDRVTRFNRRKCFAMVRVSEGTDGFAVALPLSIPVRREAEDE